VVPAVYMLLGADRSKASVSGAASAHAAPAE